MFSESDKSLVVDRMFELFINRVDIFPQMRGSGSNTYWVKVDKPLTKEIMSVHLDGKISIGAYAGDIHGMANWLCIDIDDLDRNNVLEVVESLIYYGIPHLIEFSGKKGFHVWIFLTEPAPVSKVRAVGRAICDFEIYPGHHATKDKPGVLVKLPFAVHKGSGSGRRALLLNEHLETADQKALLFNIEKIDFGTLYNHYCGEQYIQKQSVKTPIIPSIPLMKPCIAEAMAREVLEGGRNRTGFVIAVELKRLGKTVEETTKLLLEWNQLNNPQLSEREIRQISVSAHKGNYYHSCEGTLKPYIGCVDPNCEYVQRAKAHGFPGTQWLL